jgi:hypothetical protein
MQITRIQTNFIFATIMRCANTFLSVIPYCDVYYDMSCRDLDSCSGRRSTLAPSIRLHWFRSQIHSQPPIWRINDDGLPLNINLWDELLSERQQAGSACLNVLVSFATILQVHTISVTIVATCLIRIRFEIALVVAAGYVELGNGTDVK